MSSTPSTRASSSGSPSVSTALTASCRVSTRGAELIERLRDGENREADYDLLVELCDTMEHTSLCAMGGMTPYPVQSVLKHFAEDFSPRGAEK